MLLCIGRPAQAQTFFGLEQQLQQQETVQIQLNISPRAPRSNQLVTVSITSPSVDVDRAIISWYRNGALVESRVGKKEYSFRLGEVGSVETVRANVRGVDGSIGDKTITIRPADVLIVWQADSYTPPFYRGKALHATEGSLLILAIPDVFENGSRVPTASLVFTWERDGVVLGNLSGTGRDTLTLGGSILSRPVDIGVTVNTLSGNVTTSRRIRIPVTTPKVYLYGRDPLLGVLFNTALSNIFELKNEEIVVEAFPFFFSTQNRENTLSYQWRLGGALLDGWIGPRVTLRQVGSTGQATLSVRTDNTLGFLESVGSSVVIDFGR